MKNSGTSALFGLAVLFLITVSISCSGDLADPVTPVSNTTIATHDGTPAPNDETPGETGHDEIETSAMVSIDIEVLPCDVESRSRAAALRVYSLTNFNMEVFAQERYNVRWYSFDGATLSETNRLECVAGGTYFADVIDEVTERAARATITL